VQVLQLGGNALRNVSGVNFTAYPALAYLCVALRSRCDEPCDSEVGTCVACCRDLSFNTMVGTMPVSLCGWLSGLPTGSMPCGVQVIPSAGCPALLLAANELSGTIPACFGDAPLLSALNLGTNYLNGALPGSFSNLTSLGVLCV
jgi:hypothetical protein